MGCNKGRLGFIQYLLMGLWLLLSRLSAVVADEENIDE